MTTKANSSLLVKNAARNRQAARKAGIVIEEHNPDKLQEPQIEQEQPDIM